MVRPVLAFGLLALCVVPDPARAQGVDWRAAGGDLFGRASPPALEADLDPGAARALPSSILAQPYGDLVAAAAERHGIDAKLLHALIIVESGYRPDARSPVGAGGLTQLMPATARELGVSDRFDPAQNLAGGAAYLAQQIARFGDIRLALAAYNAGPGRVARLGRIPEIAETQAYVIRVVDCYLTLTARRAARHARECRAPGDAP